MRRDLFLADAHRLAAARLMFGEDRLVPIRGRTYDVFQGLHDRFVGHLARRIDDDGIFQPARRLHDDALPLGKRVTARPEIIGLTALLKFNYDNLCHGYDNCLLS